MTKTASSGRWTETMARPVLLLLVFTFVLNANALSAFFVGDDFDFLRGMKGLSGVLDTASFSFWGEWEPVWWSSWYIDFALWGARPLGFHLTNVLWYAVCVVSLFGVVRTAWPQAPFVGWAAALLFATHPVHDEAVTYLAARGHPMATGLGLAALWATTAARGADDSAPRRRVLWVVALACAFLAALAKETLLVLPVWAGALEGAVTGGPARRRLRRAATATAIFTIPAAATIVLRALVVGMESDKLTGALENPAALVTSAFEAFPSYALLAGLPLPLAFASEAELTSLRWLGWVLFLAATFGWLVLAARTKRSGAWVSTGLQLWAVGGVMFVVGLAPVLWADLGLRRRYVFSPSVGVVLIACALLYFLHARAPRVARLTLGLLVLLGFAATWHRNELYVRSGALAENVLITLRGAPLDEPALDGPREAALLTLPRGYGGDSISGAYLYHHTDLASGLRFYDAAARRIHYALKCYYAEDYATETHFTGPEELTLTVTFRGRRAFDDASGRDPAEDRFGDLLFAELQSRDEETLRLHYRVRLRPGFWERAALYTLSDGAMQRLYPPATPDDPAVDLSKF